MVDCVNISRFMVCLVGIALSVYALHVELSKAHNKEYKALCRLNGSSFGHAWKDDAINYTARERTAGPLSQQTFYRFFLWARTVKGWSETPAEAVVFTGGSTG